MTGTLKFALYESHGQSARKHKVWTISFSVDKIVLFIFLFSFSLILSNNVDLEMLNNLAAYRTFKPSFLTLSIAN